MFKSMAPRFPPVPRSPFWSSDEAAARASLAAIARWRGDLAQWLAGPERDDGLSPALAAVMLELLGAAETEAFRRYPYRLARFPALPATLPDPCATLRGVLLWRAGVVDFLSDVWDTLGAADFGLEECQRMATLLAPAGSEDACCPLCLEPLPPGSAARHFDACAVQTSWRDASR